MNVEFDEYQKAEWADTTNLRPHDHPVVQEFTRLRMECIKTMLGTWEPKTALDVGCGDGFGMMSMHPIVKVIHGCDRSPAMLSANPVDPAFLKECDAYALPYDASTFDFVYCWELLHHIGDPEAVVREMARVASTCVMICEPNSMNPAMALFGLLYPHERGLLRFTHSYPRKLLERAGLKNIRSVSEGWFTPNRTPEWMMRFLSKLPQRIPMFGLYTITLGFKETNSGQANK